MPVPEIIVAPKVIRETDFFGVGVPGIVPGSPGGTTDFLRADGTWAEPVGGGGGLGTLPDDVAALEDSVADVAASVASIQPVLRLTFHATSNANLPLTNHPSTLEFIAGSSRNIQLADLANCTQVRLHNRVVSSSASANTPRLLVRYVTSYSATAGDYGDIGTSEVSTTLASGNHQNSGWLDLDAGAIADGVFVAVMQIGGDGAADPTVAGVVVEFR